MADISTNLACRIVLPLPRAGWAPSLLGLHAHLLASPLRVAGKSRCEPCGACTS